MAVADTHNYVVRIFSSEGKELRTIGSEGGGPGEFTYLTDVEFDAGGNLYVSEHGRDSRIQKFDPKGKFVMKWGTEGRQDGQFSHPAGLAMDKDDRVRACYLHACLKYVQRDYLTNTSLRGRFGIEEKNRAMASRLIRVSVEAGAIAVYDPDTSPKHMKYVPWWAVPSRLEAP